ncbi:hypothetical protein [Streptomyces sp. NPDC057617]|uniref:hypothetical protein n=1 Tax=Streptomyces sp. NPDC057617 TaxID=3346184 RepID=UPI0036AA10DA
MAVLAAGLAGAGVTALLGNDGTTGQGLDQDVAEQPGRSSSGSSGQSAPRETATSSGPETTTPAAGPEPSRHKAIGIADGPGLLPNLPRP